MGLIPFRGKKEGTAEENEGQTKGLRLGRKLKILFLVVILTGGSVGASGGATIYGFTHGAVSVAENFEVDAASSSGSFWVSLQNRGYLPLTLDVTFALRTVQGGLDLGSQTASYKLGPKATANQTLTYSLTPDMLAALTNGATLAYTPTVKGTYAWFVNLAERELSEEQLTVARLNTPPTITAISASTQPVEAGHLAYILVEVEDMDRDRLSLEYSIEAGSLLGVTETAKGWNLTWQAPRQVGEFTFSARAFDGVDRSNTSALTLPVVDTRAPVLTLTNSLEPASEEVALEVASDEPILGNPIASLAFTSTGRLAAVAGGSGRAVTAVEPDYRENLTLTASGPNLWRAKFTPSQGGQYLVTATAEDYVGNVGGATALINLEKVNLSATEPAVLERANVTLTVKGRSDIASLSNATLTVNEVDRASPLVPQGLESVGRFLQIEAPPALKERLEQVTVVVNYTAEDVAALEPPLTAKDLKLYFYNPTTSTWELEPTTVDTTNRTLTAVLDHLSLFGIFGSNLAPSVTAGNDLQGQTGEALTVTATAEDADGQIVSYEWDFEGDGIYDWNGTTATATHAYPGPGVYSAKIKVTDDNGATGFDSLTVTIEADQQNPGWSLPGPGLAGLVVGLAATALLQSRRRPQR